MGDLNKVEIDFSYIQDFSSEIDTSYKILCL